MFPSLPPNAGPYSRETLFRIRAQQVLGALGVQYPSLFVTGDFWRQLVLDIDPEVYSDTQLMKWTRLAEQEPIFFFAKNERFYQIDIGVINQVQRYIMCPSELGIVEGDHAVVNGESYRVVERQEAAGICKLMVDLAKSNWVNPGRDVPTYRLIGMRGVIQ